jgi:hypothetical protein
MTEAKILNVFSGSSLGRKVNSLCGLSFRIVVLSERIVCAEMEFTPVARKPSGA